MSRVRIHAHYETKCSDGVRIRTHTLVTARLLSRDPVVPRLSCPAGVGDGSLLGGCVAPFATPTFSGCSQSSEYPTNRGHLERFSLGPAGEPSAGTRADCSWDICHVASNGADAPTQFLRPSRWPKGSRPRRPSPSSNLRPAETLVCRTLVPDTPRTTKEAVTRTTSLDIDVELPSCSSP